MSPRPLRILTLANTLLTEDSGSGYVILGYARELAALGHRVELLGVPDFELFFGRSRGIGYRQALGMARACRQRLRREHFDVVEIYGAEGWLAFSLLAQRRRRPLLVSHSNGIEPHCEEVLRRSPGLAAYPRAWYQLDLSRLHQRAFRAADAVVTVGRYDHDWALARGYQPVARLLAIENPLPETYLGRRPRGDREPLIGFCGSYIPRKGTRLLESDLPRILRRHPGWRFVLVGVGDQFNPSEHFPAELLPRIDVVPFADRLRALPALYERMSILVLPSLYESFGLTAAEAMACGCAVAVAPVGFGAALADGEEAVLLGGSEPPALFEAVHRLVADPALRARVAAGGWRRVQALSWPAAGRTLAAAYQRWVAERERDGGRP